MNKLHQNIIQQEKKMPVEWSSHREKMMKRMPASWLAVPRVASESSTASEALSSRSSRLSPTEKIILDEKRMSADWQAQRERLLKKMPVKWVQIPVVENESSVSSFDSLDGRVPGSTKRKLRSPSKCDSGSSAHQCLLSESTKASSIAPRKNKHKKKRVIATPARKRKVTM